MESLRTQLKQTLRRLGATPMFTIATLVTLAVGIGANTAMFSVIEGVLLKPLRYPDPEQLVGVWHTAPGVNIKLMPTSPSMYFIYRAAFALSRVMASLLFKVSPVDPATYGSMSLSLVLTTLLASYVPSCRAANVDPALALRAE